MRGAPVHLHPSRPDGSPPSAVRRHHKHENTDEHSASRMSPHIRPAVCLTVRSSNTRTGRGQHSDIKMFLNARRCCSEGGMRGALVHLQPTRPRVSNRDRGHPRGALQEVDRILHERFVRVFDRSRNLMRDREMSTTKCFCESGRYTPKVRKQAGVTGARVSQPDPA